MLNLYLKDHRFTMFLMMNMNNAEYILNLYMKYSQFFSASLDHFKILLKLIYIIQNIIDLEGFPMTLDHFEIRFVKSNGLELFPMSIDNF